MFDRTVLAIGGGTHHHTTVEKRAPTDESVRLLREMESKAQEQVERAIRLADNGFECVAHVHRECMSDDLVVLVHFMLAGRRLKAEYRHRRFDPLEGLGRGVVRAVSDRIAEEVLTTLAQQLDRTGAFH